MGYYIALQNIEIQPGSGAYAYAAGARIPGDVVERLGIDKELVRPVEGDQEILKPAVHVQEPAPAQPRGRSAPAHHESGAANDNLKANTE